MTDEFFPYAFDRLVGPSLRLLGVRPDRDGVRVEDDRLTATFGFLNVQVSLANLAEVRETGPYRWYRALGPRLSKADHGVTFGTTVRGGVCITFVDPVPAVFGPWEHPALTVTVDDRQTFIECLRASRRAVG